MGLIRKSSNYSLSFVLACLGILTPTSWCSAELPSCTTCCPLEGAKITFQAKKEEISRIADDKVEGLRLQRAAKMLRLETLNAAVQKEVQISAQISSAPTLDSEQWQTVIEYGVLCTYDVATFGAGGIFKVGLACTKGMTWSQKLICNTAFLMERDVLYKNIISEFTKTLWSKRTLKDAFKFGKSLRTVSKDDTVISGLAQGVWNFAPVVGPCSLGGNSYYSVITDKRAALDGITELINVLKDQVIQLGEEIKTINEEIKAVRRQEVLDIKALHKDFQENVLPNIAACKPTIR